MIVIMVLGLIMVMICMITSYTKMDTYNDIYTNNSHIMYAQLYTNDSTVLIMAIICMTTSYTYNDTHTNDSNIMYTKLYTNDDTNANRSIDMYDSIIYKHL